MPACTHTYCNLIALRHQTLHTVRHKSHIQIYLYIIQARHTPLAVAYLYDDDIRSTASYIILNEKYVISVFGQKCACAHTSNGMMVNIISFFFCFICRIANDCCWAYSVCYITNNVMCSRCVYVCMTIAHQQRINNLLTLSRHHRNIVRKHTTNEWIGRWCVVLFIFLYKSIFLLAHNKLFYCECFIFLNDGLD